MSGRSERLMAALVRLLPPARRELGAGLVAEASVMPGGRGRAAWLAGGVWFVLREGVLLREGMMRVWYGIGLFAATALLVAVDRIGTSDDSGQVSMLALLVLAAALGFAAPRRAWLAALVLGSALAVAGLVYATLGPAALHREPAGVAGAATLFVLVVPAAVGAYLGAGARWLLRRGSEEGTTA
jgi:hypothetical protein